MTDLITTLEAAAEGSRELDEAIGVLMGYEIGKDIGLSPHYTTSLDMAILLVPPGANYGFLSEGTAWVWPNGGFDLLAGIEGKAPTPALALVIACLRAREA